MSVRRIIEAFETWREAGEPLVLVTVYDTVGSTYSKAGHRILIAGNGDFQGLVSGGCLEGDLAERARGVLEGGTPTAVTYDMRDDADDLWGLGVGCNGLIRVFMQPLDPAGGYEPFASIARQSVGADRAVVATVVASQREQIAAGATLIFEPRGQNQAFGLERLGGDDALRAALLQGCRRVLDTGRAALAAGEAGADVLYAPLDPVPRVLVLGAGLDAIPVVGMAADLGWFVTVADHRPAYIGRGGFERAEAALTVDPRALARHVDLERFDAVVVMSHHLVTDQTYLSQLTGIRARYLGVLGPPARRARLLQALGEKGEALRPRLRGPVGLDIGADSPESIALSIVAELHAHFSAASRER
ncbi:MAG: XdhC family protein [Gammaproteobacteria bacterium]|nr:XdhC family protein [Gammaproteobacteria bacterium]